MARPKDKKAQSQIASERIGILFTLAAELAPKDKEAADRLVALAHRISLRTNVGIPKRFKIAYCRDCKSYLSSETASYRLDPANKRLRIRCLGCGSVRLLPYRRS